MSFLPLFTLPVIFLCIFAAFDFFWLYHLFALLSICETIFHFAAIFAIHIFNKGAANDIDWEYAGILPYPTSLARLIAHGEEDESAFFFMTQKDKDYAIDYYYEHLLKENGIDYNAYRKTLDYFLLYEYCEWIMLGIEYNDTGSERFQKYYSKAKEHIKKLK